MRLFVSFMTIFSIHSAVAAVDIPGADDLSQFDRYPLSSIVEYQADTTPEYALALGIIKKVNGVAAPEKQRYLTGDLTKITYQIPSGHSTNEVAAFVQKELAKRQADILYQCEARSCGSSNDWANIVFGIPKLYGLTGEQYYWAATLGNNLNMAIYLTQRGNRQVFLHIEALQSQPSASGFTVNNVMEKWQKGQRVYVASTELSADVIDVVAQAVQQIMDERPFSKVWFVGHQGGTSPFLILLSDSERHAEQLRQTLVDLGLPQNRLKARGLGPLAPAYDNVPEQRIEILVE